MDDPAIASWFLGEGDHANPATDLRAFTTGNLVQPLVDGRSYFARLCAELMATRPGDQVYFLDFRGDLDERLDGPGSEIGEVLGLAARRKSWSSACCGAHNPNCCTSPRSPMRSSSGASTRTEARCCSMPVPDGAAAITRSW
jgi:hypothetical protein